MSSAVAPYVPFYASAQPYITVAEFLAAPTGVDTTQLIPGGAAAANGAALSTQIRRASAYADTLCHQVLAATSDLEAGEYRVQRGSLRIPLPFSPVVEVTGVSVGCNAGALQPLADLSGIWFRRKVIRVPIPSLPSAGLSGAVTSAGARPGYLFAEVAYVNGYANTALAGAVLVGAQSVTVASALGIFPGMPLTVCDDDQVATEQVTVGAGYVLGSTTVPLAAPLTFAHDVGTAISALPEAVKQATVALTAHLIKTRGAEALALAGVSGGPSKVEQSEPGSSGELALATALLAPFGRVI